MTDVDLKANRRFYQRIDFPYLEISVVLDNFEETLGKNLFCFNVSAARLG